MKKASYTYKEEVRRPVRGVGRSERGASSEE